MTAESDIELKLRLQSIVSVRKAAELRDCSTDTIRRTFKDKMVRVSKNRVGLRLGDVLATETD
jgi:hypothetical protein